MTIHRLCLPLLPALLFIAATCFGAPADAQSLRDAPLLLAQDDNGEGSDGEAPTQPADVEDAASTADATGSQQEHATSQSFGAAFFISRKHTADGWTTEWLGTLVIWFLLALSVVSIALIVQLSLSNQRKTILPEGVAEETETMLKAGKFREVLDITGHDQSYFSKVLNGALREAGNGYEAMIRGLELAADQHTTERLRRTEYLNVLGQVSPMLGLFGTVYGMILAFGAIVAAGGSADPVQLAGGIGTALTTTFWGLVVAIPALAGYAVIRNKIDALTTEATYAAEELVNQFRPRRGQATRTRNPSSAQASRSASSESGNPDKRGWGERSAEPERAAPQPKPNV